MSGWGIPASKCVNYHHVLGISDLYNRDMTSSKKKCIHAIVTLLAGEGGLLQNPPPSKSGTTHLFLRRTHISITLVKVLTGHHCLRFLQTLKNWMSAPAHRDFLATTVNMHSPTDWKMRWVRMGTKPRNQTCSASNPKATLYSTWQWAASCSKKDNSCECGGRKTRQVGWWWVWRGRIVINRFWSVLAVLSCFAWHTKVYRIDCLWVDLRVSCGVDDTNKQTHHHKFRTYKQRPLDIYTWYRYARVFDIYQVPY